MIKGQKGGNLSFQQYVWAFVEYEVKVGALPGIVSESEVGNYLIDGRIVLHISGEGDLGTEHIQALQSWYLPEWTITGSRISKSSSKFP